jgi:hypothetical protein
MSEVNINTIDAFKPITSEIAGTGNVAVRVIEEGETICFFEGERCSLDEIILSVENAEEEPSDPFAIGEELYIDLDEKFRLFNHSCSPNTYFKGENEMIAMRRIEKGEEITFDYSTTMHYAEEKIIQSGHQLWTCDCLCGAENCRGIIDQFKTLTSKEQAFYLENKYMPDFMLQIFDQKKY